MPDLYSLLSKFSSFTFRQVQHFSWADNSMLQQPALCACSFVTCSLNLFGLAMLGMGDELVVILPGCHYAQTTMPDLYSLLSKFSSSKFYFC